MHQELFNLGRNLDQTTHGLESSMEQVRFLLRLLFTGQARINDWTVSLCKAKVHKAAWPKRQTST